MEQRLESEETIKRFLLGDLPEEEQEQIQDRLLADRQYFEQLLMIENELTDDYVRGFLSDHEKEKVRNYFLAVPERRQKLRFSMALDKYVSEEELSITSEENRNFSSSPERMKPQSSAPSRKRIRKALLDESAANQDQSLLTWNHILVEAATNRELLSSLVEDDWLGLYLVAQVRSKSFTREELASIVETSEATVTAILNRLIGSGILDEHQGNFRCTKRGAEILERIEIMTGIILKA